jgi:phenylpropionate dioxygenase-like ring-hydroxylating dioxygenase large terminal subunit
MTAGDECLDCQYGHAKVFLNRSQLDYEPTETRLKTATHELGHVMGLAHPAKSDRTPQIMQQGWNGFSQPQPQDVANLNTLYPGWTGTAPKPANAAAYQPLPAATPAPAHAAPPGSPGSGDLGR